MHYGAVPRCVQCALWGEDCVQANVDGLARVVQRVIVVQVVLERPGSLESTKIVSESVCVCVCV